MFRWTVTAVAVFSIAAWASANITMLNEDMDLMSDDLAACHSDLSSARTRLRATTGDRNLAMRRAEEAWRLMQSARAAQMDATFALIRARDALKALQAENADRMPTAPAAAVYAAATVSEPAPAAKPKTQASRKKKRPRRVVRRVVVHPWWPW